MEIKRLLENSKIPKENIYYNEPMSGHTSFKIGGPAEYFIKIKTIEELKELLKITRENNIKLTVIGNGSNILVNDSGIKGIVIKIEIQKLEINDCIIKIGSGNKIAEISQKLARENFTGIEFASGIPGTIGGAIRMNAGAHGKEMKDIVENITFMKQDGTIHTISKDEAKFEYRNSLFAKTNYIILETEIKLEKGNEEEIKEKLKEYAEYRREKQPIEYPSAGSTFKRGKDFVTAKLIDEAGLKGYQIGGAQISEKHAGFIINKEDATAKDVIELIEYTKKQIYNKFGKKIETEIEII